MSPMELAAREWDIRQEVRDVQQMLAQYPGLLAVGPIMTPSRQVRRAEQRRAQERARA